MIPRVVDLKLYQPPYEHSLPSAVGRDIGNMPPGSTWYATGKVSLAVLEVLAAIGEVYPSVALCVGLPPPECALEPHLALNRILVERLAILPVWDSESVTPRRVLAAVANRRMPTSVYIAALFAAELRTPGIATAIGEQLALALGERADLPHSASWYSRAFAGCCPMKAKDWRAFGRLMCAHSAAVRRSLRLHGNHDRECVATASPRTLDAYALRYLGRTWASAIQLVGWEWLVDAGLSRVQALVFAE